MTLKSGDKAYYDSFAGLVSCEVVKIEGRSGPASTAQTVTLRVTAIASPNYKRGETIETNGLHAVPREAIRQRDYMSRIKFYDVQADSEAN